MTATKSDSAKEVVCDLLRVISRELPFAVAEGLLDENLRAFMDGKLVGRGRDSWFRWVRFLHYNADQKMSGLAIDIERMEVAGDVVSVFAKWRGDVGGKTQFSETGEVRYQIRGGKIVRIWTHKKNYVFIYGANIVRRPMFYFLLLRLMFWNPQ